MNIHYGLQLFSIRDAIAHDYASAIHQVSETGYKFVELFEDIRSYAEKLNQILVSEKLDVFGAHVPAQFLSPKEREETISAYRLLGCRYLIIPGYDLSTKSSIDNFVALVNEAQPYFLQAGFEIGYHNHSFEFLPNIDKIVPWNEIINRTNLKLEIDTFWAFNAGLNPISLMQEYLKRIIAIHLKDGIPGKMDCPLGKGKAPIQAVHQKALEHFIPIIIESETCNPSGIAEIQMCMDYLKAI